MARSLISPVTMENDNVTLQPKKERSEYILGEKLRPENRVKEYKKGRGDYLEGKRFRDDLAKYACAFLNSEGGTLLIGVEDDCIVCGVKVSSKREDQVKQEIDNIMKGFKPQVFPSAYELKFFPVTTPQLNDTCKAKQLPGLKVIEFKFKQKYQQGGWLPLYVNQKEEVYIKREGSIQGPLKPSQILEWSTPKIHHLIVTLLNCQYEDKIAELKKKKMDLYDENIVLKSNISTLTGHSSSQTNSAIVTKHQSFPKEHEEENKRSEKVEYLLERNHVLESENTKLNHELTTAFQHNLTPTPEVCANIEAIVSFFEAKEKENYNSIESELQLPTPTPAFYAFMKRFIR